MMCIKTPPANSNLTGDYFSNTFKYFKLSIMPCLNSTNLTQKCQNLKNITNYFTNVTKLQIMLIDTYLNMQDYDAIVKTFLNKENYVTIDPTQAITVSYYIR